MLFAYSICLFIYFIGCFNVNSAKYEINSELEKKQFADKFHAEVYLRTILRNLNRHKEYDELFDRLIDIALSNTWQSMLHAFKGNSSRKKRFAFDVKERFKDEISRKVNYIKVHRNYHQLERDMLKENFKDELDDNVKATTEFLHEYKEYVLYCSIKSPLNTHAKEICLKNLMSKPATTQICDENAKLFYKFGYYKCRCNAGLIGDGTPGNCFNQTFCSGRLCRLNGECEFKNNYEGYKCKCSLKCMNGGVCVPKGRKYVCKCPFNTTGSLCNETLSTYLSSRNFDGFKKQIFVNDFMSSIKNEEFNEGKEYLPSLTQKDKFKLASFIEDYLRFAAR